MVYPIIYKIILLTMKAVFEILYIPMHLLRLFQKPVKCPPIKDKLLLISATELADQIRTKQITSSTVVKTYISRINEVNPIINAIIENRFQEALEDGNKVDEFLQNCNLSENEIEEKFPLLGVPVTIKGSIAVAGMLHTAGSFDHMVKAKSDATVVKYLKEAGAIPLLMSNTPEMCCSPKTTNSLVGTTSNPYNNTRTSAGSSGGEGSLLGSGASIVGIGSDIGGSLRFPAHFCGVFGHKPSPGLVSSMGHYPSANGKDAKTWNHLFSIGPMTRYAKDLKLILNTIVEPDKKGLIKFNKKVNLSKLKVFYMEDFGSILAERLQDDVSEAIKNVVTYFDKICDTKSKKIEIPTIKYCAELSYLRVTLLSTDTDSVFQNKLPLYEMLLFLLGQSKHAFGLIGFSMFKYFTEYIPKNTLDGMIEYFEELRKNFLSFLDDNSVLITAVTPTEANYHGDSFRKFFDFGYSSVMNMVGLPATACPVGFSKNGLPIGIQIVAAPNQDHLTIAVAEELEKVFGGWKF